MKTLDVIATLLLVIGGLNWGLVGAFEFDLVAAIFGMSFGETSGLTAVVYALVGLAAIYRAGTLLMKKPAPRPAAANNY